MASRLGGARVAGLLARLIRWRRPWVKTREPWAPDDRQLEGSGARRSEIGHVATLVAASPTDRPDRTMPGARESADESDDMAHALRTPLTSIRSFSEILRDNPDLPQVTRERFLGIVLTESQRLDRVIEQLLHIRPPS